MTKQEQATLDELRMTEAELEARQAKVSQLLNGEATLNDQLKASIALVDEKKSLASRIIDEGADAVGVGLLSLGKTTRKKRKDAGVPKGPKPTQTGCISSVQAARLRDLIDTKQSRLAELDAANDQQAHALGAVDAATAELDAYLRELQGI